MPVTNQGLLSQINLSGEVSCPLFRPHMLKANYCISCSKLINKHCPEAIPDDECLLKALEFSQKGEKTPSCILPSSDGIGALYHGGYKGVMNSEFLRKERVTHIVNTAKGLEIFGPKYVGAVASAKSDLDVTFLELNWEDSTTFSIPEADLVRCARFIHEGRSKGGAVLVHCAQGKSRSATAVIAYLMASQGGGFTDALRLVQEQRKMAEPNPTFTDTLKAFEKSAVLRDLRETLASS